MKNQLLAIAVLCSTALRAQPPACNSVTSNGNIQANQVLCAFGTYQSLNMAQNSHFVVLVPVTVGNVNNFTNADIWIYATLTVTSSLNFNGRARLHIMPGGRLFTKSSEVQNGNNVIDMQGGEWIVDGDLQLIDLTSTITQCDSKLTINANYTLAGGVGKHSLCECAVVDVKGVLGVNQPNVVTGTGLIKAAQANMNNQLTASSGINACMPPTKKLGSAVASCVNGCTALSLTEIRPQDNSTDDRVWFDGVYVHAPKDWLSVAVFDNVGRKLEGGAISGTYKVKADKGFYVVVLCRKYGQQKTLKIIK